MKNIPKKILVPGAGLGQTEVLKKAREMGLTSIVVSPKGDYPGFVYADVIYHEDVRNMEKVLEIAQREQIDGIVSDQNDIPVETMAYISEKMDLTGNSLHSSKYYTRKDLMRQKCEEIGVPSIAYGKAEDLDGTLALAAEIGFPVVCKPTDNQSSKGVFKVGNEKELEQAFDMVLSNSFSGEVIVEKYMEGRELVIDGLAIGGEYKVLMIMENFNFNLKDVFLPKVKKSPAILTPEKARELITMDHWINKSFELKNGRTHNEYLLNPHDGKFYLFDAAPRGGGTFISSHLLPYACGFDATEMQIRLALGEPLDINEFPVATKAVAYVCFYLEEGKITRIEGMDKIHHMESVIGIHDLNLRVGENIRPMTDKSNRLGPILLGASTLQELNNSIEMVKNTLIISTDRSPNAVIWD